MPTISGRNSLTTGASVKNVLAGSQYEFMPFDGTIEVLAKADRAQVTCNVFSGPDILCEPGTGVPIAPTAGTEAAPVYPDDSIAEDEAAQGDRLGLGFVNGNALTAVINWQVKITPA